MDDICAICWGDNETLNEQYKATCNHSFHKGCIKAWYQSGHPSFRFCPICRSILNGNEIDPFDASMYKLVYEEFIKLNGVCVNSDYILIKMNSPNWKALLKNLLILVSISRHQELTGIVNSTEFVIKGIDKNMTFGFILYGVEFKIQRYKFSNQHKEHQIKPKILLSKIDNLQFCNLAYLDKILLDMTNNSSDEYSFIKKSYNNNNNNNNNNNLITALNGEITASVHQSMLSRDIVNKSVCNYEEYSNGSCCVTLIPEVVKVHGIMWYRLKCIDFGLIDGIKYSEFDEMFWEKYFE